MLRANQCPSTGRAAGRGRERKERKKRDPFSLSQREASICMIRENTEAHNEARHDDAAFLSTFEFANAPIGLQSAGFCHMRFCERSCNYLTRYPNFFSRLRALVTPYRILFRVLSFFFPPRRTAVSRFPFVTISHFYRDESPFEF